MRNTQTTPKTSLRNQIEGLINQAVYTKLIKNGSLRGYAQFESKDGKFTPEMMDAVSAEFNNDNNIITSQSFLIWVGNNIFNWK